MWVNLFEYLHESSKGDRLRSIFHNGIALGKSKKLNCDGGFFLAFIRVYWARHMNCLHCKNEVAKTVGHSSPLMLVCLILMLDDLQEVKTMQSSKFDNYKEIREGLPADNHKNGIYDKETAKDQDNGLFKE